MLKGVDPEGIAFTLTSLICQLCSHKWYARKVGSIKNCPLCRSTNWNNGKKVSIPSVPIITCPKCEHKWTPRDYRLNECPKCKKKLFRVKRKTDDKKSPRKS